jgi:hypothetical protein
MMLRTSNRFPIRIKFLIHESTSSKNVILEKLLLCPFESSIHFWMTFSFWKEDFLEKCFFFTGSNIGEWRQKFDSKRWNEYLWRRGHWTRCEIYDCNKYARCAMRGCQCFSGEALHTTVLTKLYKAAFSARVAYILLHCHWRLLRVYTVYPWQCVRIQICSSPFIQKSYCFWPFYNLPVLFHHRQP